MTSRYADHQVFTISGRVMGDDGGEKGGFVVAESASQLTHSFAEWGFEVTSMASLADVANNLEILEAIASHDARVGTSDFVDLLPSIGHERRKEREVFTFVGQPMESETATLFSGFATAPDAGVLTDALRKYGFHAQSVMSYAEVRELYDYMQRVADGVEEDPSSTINVMSM